MIKIDINISKLIKWQFGKNRNVGQYNGIEWELLQKIVLEDYYTAHGFRLYYYTIRFKRKVGIKTQYTVLSRKTIEDDTDAVARYTINNFMT